MKIGTVLASYNGERFIREQLDSILYQSRPPDEMVVVDDCSTDFTVDIIREFASSACFPVRLYINKRNLGSTPSFAKAIQLSQSDILVTCDQDDIWHREKLEKIEGAFMNVPDTGLVVCNAKAIDEQSHSVGKDLFSLHRFNKQRQELVIRGEALRVFLRTAPSGNAMAFHSRFREIILPIPNDWSHDIWISLLIAAMGRVTILLDCLTMYRQHSDNQVGLVQLSLCKKIAGSRAHGLQFYKDEVSRYETLRGRIQERHPCLTEDLMRRIDEKIQHMRARSSMPKNRILRILPILAEVRCGRYQHYSGNGLLSAVRDFLL